MQLYLYSCQDLILQSNSIINICAGSVCKIKFCTDEIATIYPANSSGVLVINENILLSQSHNQIIFHKLNDEALLCEVKPFILNENIKQYEVKGGVVKLIENTNWTYIYFNGRYYGCIKDTCAIPTFEKRESDKKEYGIIQFGIDKKYIIIFNNQQIIYCNQYIDSEITKKYIQVYGHGSNMFNIGQLVKYNFASDNLEVKSVRDRGDEQKQINPEFNAIYFLEAIKCGRFKYAHNKLSYELKAMISIETLNKYFTPFDEYKYLNEQDTYITLKNNKVVGMYHLVVKNNLIDNIY